LILALVLLVKSTGHAPPRHEPSPIDTSSVAKPETLVCHHATSEALASVQR
jgi:hypothetical protein